MLPTLLLIINVVMLGYVLTEAVLTINRMSVYTPHSLRVVYVSLSVGAFYSLLHIDVIHFPTVLSNLALAYFVNRVKLNRCEITGTNHKALNI
jgi:hypothetical protein